MIRLIDQFSNPSKEVKKQAKDLERRFTDVGKKVSAVGDVFSSVGSAMTKGITAPVLAVGTASMQAFQEVDAGLDTIIQKTGATGEAMDGFKQVFEDVATKVPVDLDTVGAAVGEINTRLGLVGAPLEEATEKFLKFSELNGTDVESSIRLVTRAMGDAGIATEEYGAILDQLNVAGQVSGVSVDALAESLAKYGAPMRALGIDSKNAIAMFAGWEKAGVNTEIAFSGMKKAISNWGKEGKDASAEFSKVMQKIKDAPTIADATALSIEAFGAKAGPDLADAIQNGRFEVDEYIKALDGASGSVEKTFEGTADGVDKLKTAGNALKIALADIGGILSESVAPLLDRVTDGVKQATKWWRSLDTQTQQSIVKFAAIAAAAGPLLMVLGKVTSGIGGVISTMGKLSGSVMRFAPDALVKGLKVADKGALKAGSSFKLFGGGLKALLGPVGLIAMGAVLVYRNWDFVAPVFEKVGGKLKEFWEAAQPLLLKLGELFEKIGKVVLPILDTAFQVVFSAIGGYLTNFLDGAIEVVEHVTGVFNGILDFLDGVFTGNWEKAWNGLKEIVANAFSALVGLVKTPINAVIGLVNGAIDRINSIHFTVPEWVPGLGGKGWNGLSIPHIPNLKAGTDNWRGGIAAVSEPKYGGEIVDLPQGTRVYPHDESVRMAREEGRRAVAVTIPKLADQIVVREDADIDRIAEAIVRKIKEASLNMV